MTSLIIDIGNTNIVFGVTTHETWNKIWRIQTDWSKTADEYEVIFRSLLAGSDIDSASILRTVLSSVVPSLVRPFKEMIARLFGNELLVVGPEMYNRLPIRVLKNKRLICGLSRPCAHTMLARFLCQRNICPVKMPAMQS